MTRKLTISLALIAVIAGTAAIVLVLTLGGNGTKAPAHHPQPAHVAALFNPAQAAKTCSALRKSPRPVTAYALLVIGETVRVGGMHPTSSQARKAQRILESEIATTCPEFGDVPGQYASIQR